MKEERILRDKDLLKASAIFTIPLEQLRQLNEQRLLDVDHIRRILMRQDYLNYKRYIKDKPKYGEEEIIEAIVKDYKEPKKYVMDVVNKNQNKKQCFCRWCSKRITPAQAYRTGGLCAECNSDTLPKY